MAGTDASKVLIGLAEQSSTTGAIAFGDPVTTIPTTLQEALTAAANFATSGYVSEDGLSLATDYSTNDIKEWNGATVRKLLESFDGTLSWTLIQMDADAWKQAFGEENVVVNGDEIHIKMGSHLPEVKSWCFRMKDGDNRIVIFVPKGQVTSVDEITFSATDAISLPIELSCYDDGDGESIHIFVATAGSSPTPTYTYEEVEYPTGNPSENGYYELVDGEYVLSEDTEVDDSKTYYRRVEA